MPNAAGRETVDPYLKLECTRLAATSGMDRWSCHVRALLRSALPNRPMNFLFALILSPQSNCAYPDH